MARKPAEKGYQPHYPDLAYWMAHAGLTEEEIGNHFEVDRRTILRWKKAHPDFGEALMAGKETPDDQVEAALYKRALGYTFTEERVTHQGDVVTVELERAADVTACIFWLKNRRPDKWRDVHKVESTSTVNVEISENASQIITNPEAKEYARAAFRAIRGNGHSDPSRSLADRCPN